MSWRVHHRVPEGVIVVIAMLLAGLVCAYGMWIGLVYGW
jgi:hypothetical protein